VTVARYLLDEPLTRRSRTLSGEAKLTLEAETRGWQLNFLGGYEFNNRAFLTDREGASDSVIFVHPSRNPFTDPLIDALELERLRTTADTRTSSAFLQARRSVFNLPAGPLQLDLSTGYNAYRIIDRRRSAAGTNTEAFSQRELSASAGLDVPIASRRNDFLPFLGELSAGFEYTIAEVSRLGALSRELYTVRWQPRDWLRVFGSLGKNRRPPDADLLTEPALATGGVRYYDPLRRETVDVVEISGGLSSVVPQREVIRRLGLNVSPRTSINLRLNAEYTSTQTSNFLSALPSASEAVLLAFPERFRRNEQGILTEVDVRPVLFAARAQEQLRYGFSFTLPLGGAPGGTRRTRGEGSREESDSDQRGEQTKPADMSSSGGGGRTRLQINANHTVLLNNSILIEPGSSPIDLLSPAAIGIGGGRSRHQLDFTAALSTRGAGVRLISQWRSASYLNIASGNGANFLRFSPTTNLSLRAFTEGRNLFPRADWLKGTRISLTIQNLTNERQRVRDATGLAPLRYQPGYLDPIGRTVELELRKVF
jgi:hypothetical protein